MSMAEAAGATEAHTLQWFRHAQPGGLASARRGEGCTL